MDFFGKTAPDILWTLESFQTAYSSLTMFSEARNLSLMKIVIVEDEDRLGRYLEKALKEEGYSVDRFLTLDEARIFLEYNPFDLLIIDWMLPDGEGPQLISELREKGLQNPILLLTVRDRIEDKVKGFNVGADDYLTKPFHLEELLVRIRRLLERWKQSPSELVLKTADLRLDLRTHECYRANQKIELTTKEFQVLRFLLEHKGEIVSRTRLAAHCWDIHFDPGTNVIDVHIKNLRQKIDKNFTPPLIETIRGRGYRIQDVPES